MVLLALQEGAAVPGEAGAGEAARPEHPLRLRRKGDVVALPPARAGAREGAARARRASLRREEPWHCGGESFRSRQRSTSNRDGNALPLPPDPRLLMSRAGPN